MKMSVNDLETAEQVAREHNFRVVRRVGSLDGYFVIMDNNNDYDSARRHMQKRSTLLGSSPSGPVPVAARVINETLLLAFQSHPLIESIHQEPILVRLQYLHIK